MESVHLRNECDGCLVFVEINLWELLSSSPGPPANCDSQIIKKKSIFNVRTFHLKSKAAFISFLQVGFIYVSSAFFQYCVLEILIGLCALNPNSRLTEKILGDSENAIFQIRVETLLSNTWLNLTFHPDNCDPIKEQGLKATNESVFLNKGVSISNINYGSN